DPVERAAEDREVAGVDVVLLELLARQLEQLGILSGLAVEDVRVLQLREGVAIAREEGRVGVAGGEVTEAFRHSRRRSSRGDGRALADARASASVTCDEAALAERAVSRGDGGGAEL